VELPILLASCTRAKPYWPLAGIFAGAYFTQAKPTTLSGPLPIDPDNPNTCMSLEYSHGGIASQIKEQSGFRNLLMVASGRSWA